MANQRAHRASRFTPLWVSAVRSARALTVEAGRASPGSAGSAPFLSYVEPDPLTPPLQRVAIGTSATCHGDWKLDITDGR